MRLIKQITLYLCEGKADKVYEVDLCEAGDGEYVVNFRYGRRGTTLREGTKTTFPVSEAEAEAVYEKLVASKTRKGYSTTHPDTGTTATSDENQSAKASLGAESEPPTLANDPRAQRVLLYLKSAAEGNPDPSENWKLSRILWRAGEMGPREAAPYLVKIAGNGDAMHDLCLAWALGRCGDESCSGALQDLFATTTNPPAKRFAEAGLLDISEGSAREEMIRQRCQSLPPSVASVLYEEPEKVASAVQEALQRIDGAQDLLFDLYMMSPYFPGVRVAVKDALRRMPFGHNTFRPIRYIYKLAEFRNDSEVFGLLAYRFEKTPESYKSTYGGQWHEGKWRTISDIAKRPDSTLAYSYNTRAYLRKRTLRTLRRYGELEIGLYAEMATGVLLAFDDSFDRKQPRKTTQWLWERSGSRTVDSHYDVYDYPLLNHLLYKNSTRYEPQKALASWPCKEGYRPGQPAPDMREEAFPEIWDRNPEAVVRLLRSSTCFAVHEFAVRVFRANTSFAKHVDITALIEILQSPYEITAELAIDLAKRLYDPAQPNLELVASLATCPSEAGRALALSWIKDQPGVFLGDADFLQKVVFTHHGDVHAALREWLPVAEVNSETLASVAMAIIDRILTLDHMGENNELVRIIGETLLAVAGDPLSHMDIMIVLRMLDHPLDEVQALGGKLLINHETPASELDDEVFEKLINASSAAARKIGVELFGSLPDEALLDNFSILATYATSKLAELRQTVQPIIARLAARDAGFAKDIIEQCYPLLARKERYEGLHADLYQLLTEFLGDHLAVIPSEHIGKLLDSKYEQAQELGAMLLDRFVDSDQIPVRRIVRLGSHESLAVRQWVRNAYTEHLERMKLELEESVRLVDATWDDTRDFAFEYFRNQLKESDWNPDVLVAIVDSVNKPVQAFGRELITKFFSEQHGQTYLLKLSQHPSPALQLFASNYLERFAADNQERIEALELFFITVLCQVNCGRVAKDRVLVFLGKEALKTEAVAQLVMRILTRQSATMAIGDRAACIEMLREIQAAYPELETPLTVHQPSTLAVG